MKPSVCSTWLAVTVAMIALHAPPALAKRRPAATLNAVFEGSATVDQLVGATAARCKCAPARPALAPQQPGLPSVDVGSASGSAGQQVAFSASLSTAGAMVSGVQADIAFDSINTPVAATATGEPDCTVNPDIAKGQTAFAFQPFGCSGSACTAFRAVVISFSNSDPIPDGSVLYTCNVNISPGAAAGSYPLTISNVAMSTPDGQPITSGGTNGEIIVGGGPSPTPTATPAPAGPTSKDQCKHGGWRNFTVPRVFKNQGDCIKFVNTGK
jgi:hypothetical protein